MKPYLWFAFFCLVSLVGCMAGEGGFANPEPFPIADHPPIVRELPELDFELRCRGCELLEPPVFDRESEWRPRSHPFGTLLVDHRDELWMVGADGGRLPVSGDDSLGNVGLDEHDAIPMSLEEERCLTPDESRYWGSGNEAWWPVYGPYEEDPGPFILDWARYERRPVSREVLESWGYYWRWMDYFDGGEDEWSSFAFLDEPVPFRDGSLARTELGTYYLVHGRAYLFRPAELALEVGYREEDMQMMSEHRLRQLAVVTTSLRREHFDLCPADEP